MVDKIFFACYWGPRLELRSVCADRIARFWVLSTDLHPAFGSSWATNSRMRKAWSPCIANDVAMALQTNNLDSTGEPIPDLGFNLAMWNRNVTFSVSVGMNHPKLSNSVILRFRAEPPENSTLWRSLATNSIESFDPDNAVVTSHSYAQSCGGGPPPDRGGWFTYERGGSLLEHPFP